MSDTTLERQLFTWEGWDQADAFDFVFYDVTLVVPIGGFPIGTFPIGTKFRSAVFRASKSQLSLFDYYDKEYLFDLKINAVQKVG
jgi:hypothetical protein